MGLFKKKNSYYYSSNYSSSYGRRNRFRFDRIGVVIAILTIFVIAGVIFLNLTRIQLLVKGYSFGQTSDILSLEKEEAQLILSYDYLEDISTWLESSEYIDSYDEYQNYYVDNSELEKEEVVAFIDEVYQDKMIDLDGLGYDDQDVWDMLVYGASIKDLEYIIDNNLTAKQTAEYRSIEGYVIQNLQDYIDLADVYESSEYTVAIVNYPFIFSYNYESGMQEYTLTDPDNILNLVKKGFYLAASYEPSDLVIPDIPIADDCENYYVREVAVSDLEEMVDDAASEGYYLVLNSAYRSYEDQAAIYQDREDTYGGLYAAEYVAVPGASEHQTGLGIDLTSQSVIDGERMVFGDTEEYQWVLENSYKYGFIVRFDEDFADITGISHEPWHLRYVGVEVATEIYEEGVTFEEYCLENYIIPEVTEK
ncbi:M15 family metallopeptidase [Tannockella kyphosi]|uniref:M15 family metallopeptidase n=1 Tax=Tannockella kyphosi TaxID=2899121 RepID=UPI0020117631|nr:M15 family metallopeptidase [Tannockella kyphosi]